MAKEFYNRASCAAAATDEKSADGTHHHYEFSHTPTPGGPTVPLSKLKFQNGLADEVGVNGVTDRMVLAAVIDHIAGFQAGPFACPQNEYALTSLRNAIAWLDNRPVIRTPRQGSTPNGATE